MSPPFARACTKLAGSRDEIYKSIFVGARAVQLASDDLVRRQVVAVIVANSTSAFAVKAATTTIPMVFLTGSDPIEGGLVTNLNRPGDNITGVVFFSDELGTKRLELLR